MRIYCPSSADETVYRNCGRIYFRTCFFWSGESSPNQFKRCPSSADEIVYRNCGRIYFQNNFSCFGKNHSRNDKITSARRIILSGIVSSDSLHGVCFRIELPPTTVQLLLPGLESSRSRVRSYFTVFPDTILHREFSDPLNSMKTAVSPITS